jgi:uroporphyrinogen decarboxylase
MDLMRPRERVIITLRHEEPDRIPIDFGSTHVSTINPMCYRDLRRFLGLETRPARVKDVVAQLTEVDAELIELFHSDFIDVNRHLSPTNTEIYYRDTFYQCMVCLNRDHETGEAEIVDPSWKLWHHSYGNFYEEIPSLIDIVEEGVTTWLSYATLSWVLGLKVALLLPP